MSFSSISGESNIVLTKDSLKYKIKKGIVVPQFLTVDDSVCEVVEKLLNGYKRNIGNCVDQIQSDLQTMVSSGPAFLYGMNQVIGSELEYQEPADRKKDRSLWLEKGQELRRSNDCFLDFKKAWVVNSRYEYDSVRDQIYSDLGSNKTLSKIPEWEASRWGHLYNLRLLQGLVCHAESFRIKIQRESINLVRFLLQEIKFFQLAMEVKDQGKFFLIDVSGPLAFLGKRTGYGGKMAGFLPSLFLCHEWEVEVSLELKKRKVILSLDDKIPIKVFRKRGPGYIPPELTSCFERLSEKGLTVHRDVNIAEVEPGSFVVPDFVVEKDGICHNIELFHAWHSSGLEKRVGQLSRLGKRYILGVSKTLADSKKGRLILAKVSEEGNVFVFRQFPTGRAILAQLAH